MLTGLYLLHDVRTYSLDKIGSKLSAGISPQVSALSGGPPIGGSLGFGWERDLQADLLMPDAHVWAAQWRRLEVEYILDSHIGGTDQPGPIRYGLYPDVTSQGVLRGDDAVVDQARIGLTTDELADGESTKLPYSQEKRGSATFEDRPMDLDDWGQSNMTQESLEDFDELFQEALEWFESELDEDTDEESPE